MIRQLLTTVRAFWAGLSPDWKLRAKIFAVTFIVGMCLASLQGCAAPAPKAAAWKNPGIRWEVGCIFNEKGKLRIEILTDADEKSRLELEVDPHYCDKFES